MFNIGYKENDVVSHNDLCKKAKCGCMGGIRYSKENNVLLLFMKTNSIYENAWDGNILKFMGSGKGNQSLDRTTNKRLADSIKNDTAVCLFEWLDSANLKYVGRFILADKPYYEAKSNKYGEKENKIIFPLKKA